MPGFFKKMTAPTVLALVMALNGALNIATGLASVIQMPSEVATGLAGVPKYLEVAPRQHVSAFVSILLGFVLLTLAKGLQDCRRSAWLLAMGVLAILTFNNLFQRLAPPGAVFSAAILLALAIFHKRFGRRAERFGYQQFIALASVLFALAYGMIGSHVLRAQFTGIKTWTDAIYFTFVTYSTIGYGDILPQTPTAKLFVVSMIPIGVASFLTALTALMGPMVEQRIKGVMNIMKRFQHVSDHVVICGLTNVSESAMDELRSRGHSFIIIEERTELAQVLQGRGHDVIVGDPTRKETLEHANVSEAKAILAATDSDATNMLIAITARELMPPRGKRWLRIVIRVENEENVAKARMAGADEVISPSTMGGRLMAVKALEAPPREGK